MLGRAWICKTRRFFPGNAWTALGSSTPVHWTQALPLLCSRRNTPSREAEGLQRARGCQRPSLQGVLTQGSANSPLQLSSAGSAQRGARARAVGRGGRWNASSFPFQSPSLPLFLFLSVFLSCPPHSPLTEHPGAVAGLGGEGRTGSCLAVIQVKGQTGTDTKEMNACVHTNTHTAGAPGGGGVQPVKRDSSAQVRISRFEPWCRALPPPKNK